MSKKEKGSIIPHGSWTVPIQDAGDGSGDGIVNLPQEIVDGLGLKDGDTLIYTIEENGVVKLKKKTNPDHGL